LIFQHLHRLGDALDDWEKDHFRNAIFALGLNACEWSGSKLAQELGQH
jgi:hypothetical protein